MTAFDLLIAAIALFAVVGGWRLGFAQRVLSWAGLIGGLTVAAWLLPRLAGRSADVSSPRRFLLAGAVLFGGAILGQVAGGVIGGRLRSALVRARLGKADSLFGGAAGLGGVVLLLWVLLPAMAQVPGWPARAARSSEVAGWIDRELGEPPGVLGNLSDTLGVSRLPRVFDSLDVAPEVSPPPPGSPVTGSVLDAAQGAAVRVFGPACGRIQTGSGVVVAPGVIVTNAHVVAGTERIRVETAERDAYAAEVVAFDPAVDLAIVSSRSLPAAPLELGDGAAGDVGVVMGYPRGGPLEIDPFRIAQRIRAVGRDIYNRDTVRRSVFVLGASLAPGDSGSPLVGPDGRILGIAFAIAPDDPGVAYAIAGSEVRDLLAARPTGRVSTGPCIE